MGQNKNFYCKITSFTSMLKHNLEELEIYEFVEIPAGPMHHSQCTKLDSAILAWEDLAGIGRNQQSSS